MEIYHPQMSPRGPRSHLSDVDTASDTPVSQFLWKSKSLTSMTALLLFAGSDGKASVYNAGDLASIPGSGRSAGEGNGNPLQYYCLEKSRGQRSLVGYSPWGCKEPDTTERLHLLTYSHIYT